MSDPAGPPPGADQPSFRWPSDVPPLPNPAGMGFPQPFPDDFLITALLGEGSQGKVWLAEDLHLPRKVALKTLRRPPTDEDGQRALAALRRDAHFLIEVQHPNIVRVYGWREAGGRPYLVLEHVPGDSLAALVTEKPLPWDRAARYVADVAAGLLVVHGRGVVHRDIKPGNILLNEKLDEAKLTDFGVAAWQAEASTITGSPGYMAPEAFAGAASAASDVYSLAATLFRLVAGEVPFPWAGKGSEQAERIEQGLSADDPRFEGLPDAIEQVVRAGLAAKPEQRPALRAFLDQLRGALNQSITDDMATPPEAVASPSAPSAPVPVALRLSVSREASVGLWNRVAATRPTTRGLRRDAKRVPGEPDRARVRTGERVRIEVTAAREGHVVVFNVGPTGNLTVLHPEGPLGANPAKDVWPDRPLFVPDIVFSPPSGRERLVAVWSTNPLPLTEKDLRSLADEPDASPSRAYRASRDLKRVRDAVRQAAPGECRVAVLELEHTPA